MHFSYYPRSFFRGQKPDTPASGVVPPAKEKKTHRVAADRRWSCDAWLSKGRWIRGDGGDRRPRLQQRPRGPSSAFPPARHNERPLEASPGSSSWATSSSSSSVVLARARLLLVVVVVVVVTTSATTTDGAPPSSSGNSRGLRATTTLLERTTPSQTSCYGSFLSLPLGLHAGEAVRSSWTPF